MMKIFDASFTDVERLDDGTLQRKPDATDDQLEMTNAAFMNLSKKLAESSDEYFELVDQKFMIVNIAKFVS